jgi:hypothetical protein
VGDVPNDGLSQAVVPAVYVPYTTMLVPYAQYNIRTRGNSLSYLERLRTAVASVAADQQISTGASTLEEALEGDSQWTRQRLFSVLRHFFRDGVCPRLGRPLQCGVVHGVAEDV